ncbi:MAG: hydroxymethylglutaryl-CoA lyase [Crocinitomicaceae bacterium]|nr:hydroxymethylglutaryl-CoA lyase [Crocinitomicaceae bacterium]
MKLIECPRDAMQGIKELISTEKKAAYINQLLKVGFDTVDFGSFVSPKAIPQMADTAEVLSKLDLSSTKSKLLAIVANPRGATNACVHQEIDYLGFPFSVSETFQKRNTNASIEDSLHSIEEIQELCTKHNKKLVIYLSMAFGNPYGDEWSPQIVTDWAHKVMEITEVETLSLSDTIGVSNKESIENLFSIILKEISGVEIGAHMHTTPTTWREKVDAAYNAGCRRFDGALKGYGGCPMAKDELTGNMPTEKMIEYFNENKVELGLNQDEFAEALKFSNEVFN